MTLAYDEIETPIGPLLAVFGERGVVRIGLPSEEPAAVLGELDEPVARSPRELEPVRRELDGYFAGRRREFALPLDLRLAHGFHLRVLEEMAQIPFGQTVTYTELAGRAGNARASRAAGHACATNPIPIVVPCHRVVGSDGNLRGYTGGLEFKERLLRHEGVDPARPLG